MTKSCVRYLAACLFVLGTACLPAGAVNPPVKPLAPSIKAVTPPAKVAPPREFGGKMPLPVDQRIERQNKPSDKLLVEVTRSVKEGNNYVAYVKVVWGDLDNLIKGTGPQYYSDWDGSLKIANGTGAIDEKIQFDDGKRLAAPKPPVTAKPPSTVTPPVKPPEGPRVGSGRDEVEIAAGRTVVWKAGVVGVLDGLRIKITSPVPTIQATLTAGKFTIPITIAPGSTPPVASGGNTSRSTILRLNPKLVR